MENQNISQFSPELLTRIIRAQFPEITDITGDSFWMTVQLNPEVKNASPFLKAMHGYLKDFLELHGNQTEQYQFTVERDHELIDVLHFNDPDAAHFIEMELFGKQQRLRIQDVLGATGDYTIFNEDFERVGGISPISHPPTNPDGSLVNPEDMDGYHEEVYPDFNNESIWEVYPAELKPYLPEILGKVLEQINSKAEPMTVDVNDPEDVAFWAEQFELSEADLKKAVLAAGKSIDDITAYLQK